MTPATANRLAITSTIAAVLLLGAYATENGLGRTKTCSLTHEITATTPRGTDVQPENVQSTVDDDSDTATSENEIDATASENENKVRQAVRDLVKERYNNSRVEGVFTLAFRVDNLYLGGADTILSDGSRHTLDVLVRQYTKRSGGTYWRAESIGAEEAAAYREQLND